MCRLTTFRTTALAIATATGNPALGCRADFSINEKGQEFFTVTALDCQHDQAHTMAYGETEEAALTMLAKALKVNYPLPAPTYAVSGSAEGITPTQASIIQYATTSQKEEIIRLLNHPLITRQEKTKMLLSINRLDEERATQAIAKLRKAIEDREGTTALAA